jgi:hypothetical protein
MTVLALPTGATLGFSYEFGVDIDIPALDVATWFPIRKITGVAPSVTPVTASAQTYDDLGAPNDEKTSESWSLSFTVQVNRLATTGAYTDEVEALKAYTEPSAVGTASIAHVRYYDKPANGGVPNPDDAYEGYCTVSIDRSATGNADVGAWSVTLTGKGKRTKITNPAV